MKKIVLSFLEVTEKLHLIIYQIIIVFTMFFYLIIKGASGHNFVITNEEKIYSILLFLTFVLSGFYKERKRFNKKVVELIIFMFLIAAFFTLLVALYFLTFSINFDYEFRESPIMISITGFLMPILFIWINFYLIRSLINQLKNTFDF